MSPFIEGTTFVAEHNHPTRDIKELGVCPGCDTYLTRGSARLCECGHAIGRHSSVGCHYEYDHASGHECECELGYFW